MNTKTKLDSVANVLLIAALAVFLVRSLTQRPNGVTPLAAAREVSSIASWQSIAAQGVPFGDSGAVLTVTVFSDFECPFCRRFHESLQAVRKDASLEIPVRVSFVHYPLGYHRFAMPAARAAECADAQGSFEAMADVLFAHQDSFGLVSWRRLAEKARVPSPDLLESCLAQPREPVRISRGLGLASAVDIAGTPTVLVNQWRLPGTPSRDQLAEVIRRVSAGGSPASVFKK